MKRRSLAPIRRRPARSAVCPECAYFTNWAARIPLRAAAASARLGKAVYFVEGAHVGGAGFRHAPTLTA